MATLGQIPSNTDFTGIVLPYAGSAAPDGWLLCDGSAVSRTTYSDLFGLVGTTYGAGDGSTTFNLPDLRGRLPLGKDDMGGSAANRVTATQADNLGQGSGAETHTLIEAEMPSHGHDIDASTTGSSHSHNASTGRPASASSTSGAGSTGTNTQPTANTGSGNAHNNMPPYATLNYIIKT